MLSWLDVNNAIDLTSYQLTEDIVCENKHLYRTCKKGTNWARDGRIVSIGKSMIEDLNSYMDFLCQYLSFHGYTYQELCSRSSERDSERKIFHLECQKNTRNYDICLDIKLYILYQAYRISKDYHLDEDILQYTMIITKTLT